MIHAYNKIYLDDAMHNLGEMFDYAQNACHIEPEIFWDMFIASGYADRFAIGMPAVVSGRSGTEIAMDIFSKQDASEAFPEPYNGVKKSKAYWCGSMLAYYQRRTGRSFQDIHKRIAYSDIEKLYTTLHDASKEQVADLMDQQIHNKKEPTRLHTLRLASGYTQKELAEKSGVNLRTLQQYEIRGKDINKAASANLMALAKVLGCHMEDLMEYDAEDVEE